MQYTKISPEQAAALARRDRNRLIAMCVLAVLVGGAYLVTIERSAGKAAQADAAAVAEGIAARDETLEDVIVPEFEHPELLEQIRDGSSAEQELLAEEPLAAVFDYARVRTDSALRAMGIVELDAERQAAIMADPAGSRLAPLRARGKVVAVRRRPRAGQGIQREDWMGTLETLDGRHAHFLVAAAPLQADGERRVDPGDYLRVDGLFHALYRSAVDGEVVSAPLILGARIEPTTAPMDEETARLAPDLARVKDDTVGEIHPAQEFDAALWQLMGRAALLADETDWETAPELNSQVLAALYENGEEYRGRPFRVPVSINMDTYSVQVDDNPLRIERQTVGWIGNSTWKGSVKTIKWIGPFTRQDMLRTEIGDDHRYVTARGYFLRNHVFENSNGQPIRAPVFVMESVDVFTPTESRGVTMVKYGVAGLTVLLISVIFFMLRADRRRSRALYEDMVRRKRARRDRAAERQSAAGPA